MIFDIEHFVQGTWTEDAHDQFQDILFRYFKDFWVVPKQDATSTKEHYDITMEEIWNQPSSQGGKRKNHCHL